MGGKKLPWGKMGESMDCSKAKSGVMGEGVCMFESDESLRTRRGVGGEAAGEDE